MPVQIFLAQAGAPAGITGVARSDFVTGVPVQATAVGGPYSAYLWQFVSKAENVDSGVRASSAFGSANSPVTFISPIDVAGEYLLQVSVDSGHGLGADPDDVARIVFYAGTVGGNSAVGPLNTDPAELPQQLPAFGEKLEDNVADAIDPLGNITGWARKWSRLKSVINRIYAGKSWAWGRVAQTAGGCSLVQGFNVATVVRTDVGQATVTFTRALGTSSYAVVATARGTAGSVTALAEGSTSFNIERADIGGLLVDADWTFNVKRQS